MFKGSHLWPSAWHAKDATAGWPNMLSTGKPQWSARMGPQENIWTYDWFGNPILVSGVLTFQCFFCSARLLEHQNTTINFNNNRNGLLNIHCCSDLWHPQACGKYHGNRFALLFFNFWSERLRFASDGGTGQFPSDAQLDLLVYQNPSTTIVTSTAHLSIFNDCSLITPGYTGWLNGQTSYSYNFTGQLYLKLHEVTPANVVDKSWFLLASIIMNEGTWWG